MPELPDEVRSELQRALNEIAEVLVRTNERLSERGFPRYYTLSGTRKYNDPRVPFEAESAHVALLPVDENGNERAFDEVREAYEVAAYSSRQGKIVDNIRLASTHLSANGCNEDTIGQRCGQGGRCKSNWIEGYGTIYYCDE